MSDDAPAFEMEHLSAGYGRTRVLHDVTVRVGAGSVVGLLGSNGAGKTTLLRTAAGLMPPWSGSVRVFGKDVSRAGAVRLVRSGVCLIPEGRGVFRSLTVHENLTLQVPRWITNKDVERVYEVFPALKPRAKQVVGTMSGGEQQMVALSRAYLAQPKIIMLDEVSMGLAPKIVSDIFETITQLARTGVSMLIVEQYVSRVLAFADDVYVLRKGSVVFSGRAEELSRSSIVDQYLGG